MSRLSLADDAEAQALVAVVNDPADLVRARDEGWYRIPLAHAPARIGAEYLAFYQTGAFPESERWQVRWLAPIRGYYLAQRRELIPSEPDHPRAGETYYKITLGPLSQLPSPIPSRRLRRITFIQTTLGRLVQAGEINDLWVRTGARERLWEALHQAELEPECNFPIAGDGEEDGVVDFALPCREGAIAVLVEGEPAADAAIREAAGRPDYLMAIRGWQVVRVPVSEIETGAAGWASRLAALCAQLGGLT